MDLTLPEIIAWYVVFVFSVTLHEAAHAWAAKKGGDLTAYLGGQVSLDPVPHIRRSPFGMVILPVITLFLTGWPIGFASAPYDPHWAHRYPRRAAWMAMAGPASNLLLVIISMVFIYVGIFAGIFEIPSYINIDHIADATGSGLSNTLVLILSITFSMNLVLFVLNMIPLPPLDGRELITFFVSEDRAQKMQETLAFNSHFTFFGLIIAWHFFEPLFQIFFLIVINVIYPGHHYG